MKLIEAMKKIKDLQRKTADLRDKVQKNCAHLNIETPTYGDKQREQVNQWLQAHRDIVQEIAGLRTDIQRTNLATFVSIELGDKQVTKTIAEWIHRRRDLAKEDMLAYQVLTDRNLQEGLMQDSFGNKTTVKIVRNYDPADRDKMLEMFRSEPGKIDATLEVVNAVTDVITL